MKKLILIIFVVSTGLLFSLLHSHETYYFVTGKIERIIDGDTVLVNRKYKEIRIRLIYVDTMESRKNRKLSKDFIKLNNNGFKITKKQILEFGKKAKFHMTIMLKPGMEVILKIKKENEKDRYGRLLAEVYYKSQNINIYLIQKGYALKYFIGNVPYSVKKVYTNAENEAKNKRIGIWQYKIT